MYSSRFHTVGNSYQSVPTTNGTKNVVARGTLEEIVSFFENPDWYVGTQRVIFQDDDICEQCPVIANTKLNSYFTWYQGTEAFDQSTLIVNDTKGTKYSAWQQYMATYYSVCIPNENNIIIGNNQGFFIVISKMKDAKAQDIKTLMILARRGSGNIDYGRYQEACNLSQLEKPTYVMGYGERIRSKYNTSNLARVLTTNVLYSVDTTYESDDAYISTLDTKKLSNIESVQFNDVEYVGINFNFPSISLQPSYMMYNHYFKVQKEI